MAFGRKMGSLKTLKKTLEKGSSNNVWIKYIPKNGSRLVRFTEEPEHWINYLEHFDTVARRSYPCNGESSCPGCMSGERKSSRYLANAIDIDDSGSEQAIALQLPKDLANRLVVRYERNGTLTDRDFELMRSGEGLDTIYELDAHQPRKRNLAKFAPFDLEKTLEDAYNDVFGGGDDDDNAPPLPQPRKSMTTIVAADEDDEDAEDDEPVVKPKRRSKAAQAVVEVDDDDDEDEDDEPVAKPKPAAKRAAAKAGKPIPDPVFEADEDDDEDEEAEYDEDTLRNMPLGALRAVSREFGVNPKGMTQDEIVDAILEAGDPVDDEDDVPAPPY